MDTSGINRKASHAGSWYTSNSKKLNKELEGWLEAVPTTPEDGSLSEFSLPISNARAIIAPHAGYSYSGPTAAYAYKCIDPEAYDRIFILGPSHHVYLDGCAVSKCTEYETPLGTLTIDKKVNDELLETGHFTTMSVQTDEDEHSIEMHLPYIYKIMEGKSTPFTVVPILVGALSTTKEEFFGKLLSPYLKNPHTLFIVSSDFCHWGSRFSYVYRQPSNPSQPIHASIEAVDREGMKLIEDLDVQGFAQYLRRTRNTICGRHPIGVLLNALKDAYGGEVENLRQGLQCRFLRYAQSSRVVSERDSSVSYASAYVCAIAN
ncbi:MEMO1 family [Cladochytrium replicatum]|nr:MEMO1 family [Cladochytrium replicatum]